MTFIPVMWIGYGILVVITAGIYLYRSRLSRDEDDELFLGEGFENEKAAQAEIAAKVNKVEPVLRIFMWLVGLATLFVIGFYIWDFISQFK